MKPFLFEADGQIFYIVGSDLREAQVRLMLNDMSTFWKANIEGVDLQEVKEETIKKILNTEWSELYKIYSF
jgi:hypothetical protein